MVTNRDQAVRDQILNLRYHMGGVNRFDGARAEVLQKLIDLGFADPNDRQNDAPSYGKIVEFLKKYPRFTGFGYAVDVTRDDYRVTLEGVLGPDGRLTQEELEAFVELFRTADEFRTTSPARAWYD